MTSASVTSTPRSASVVLLAVVLLAALAVVATAVAAARSPCRIRYPSDERIAWTCRRIRSGETLEKLFGDRWIDVARFNRIDRRHARAGVALKVPSRLDDVRDFTPMPPELPDSAAEPKFLLIDLSEQFLGAYEFGRLGLSAPLAAGDEEHPTPTGDFRISAADRRHVSSLYTIEGTETPYPMTWALRFYVDTAGVAHWLHGRDVPGFPASHGCIGLYDEHMQMQYYGVPRKPVLDDARRLYEWVLGGRAAEDGVAALVDGPRVRIVGRAPRVY